VLTSPRPQKASPVIGLVAGLVFLLLGANEARQSLRIHYDGHRVLARVAGVTPGGRHQSSTTRLTYTTIAGAGSECTMNGAIGAIGQPVWIRYLSSDPSRCSPDELGRALEPTILHVGVALLMLAGAYAVHRRAQRAALNPRRSR